MPAKRDKQTKPLNLADKILFALMIVILLAVIVSLTVFDGVRRYIVLGGGGLLILNLLFILYFARRNRL